MKKFIKNIIKRIAMLYTRYSYCWKAFRKTECYKHYKVWTYMHTSLKHKKMWLGDCYYDTPMHHIGELLQQWLTTEQLQNKQYVNRLMHKVIYALLFERFMPSEYFSFGFHVKNKEHSNYLGNIYKQDVCELVIGAEYNVRDLNDKYAFYKLTKPYFHRDVCAISTDSNFDQFEKFCAKHSTFLLKPNDSCIGHGICKVSLGNGISAKTIWEECCESNEKYIAEELIEQSSIMASFNDTSVNTVRMPCFLIPQFDGTKQFQVLHPFFRTGRKGSVVDNLGAGGMSCVVDELTGVILTNGMTYKCQWYERHPDSGIKYKGFQIPQ